MRISKKNLIGIGYILIAVAALAISTVEITSAKYRCKHCHGTFKVSVIDYLSSIHIFNNRLLKCPLCGKHSLCKREIF